MKVVQIRTIILQLYDMGGVRFGQFPLKSKIISPIYIDLRLTISNPSLLIAIAETLRNCIPQCSYDLLCGVPWAAVPLATTISIKHNIPLLLVRKEKKQYGTAKQLEGIYTKGQRCLLVEDVITSGASILETAASLEEHGVIVQDAVVFVDREQGGRRNLLKKKIQLHSIVSLTSIVNILLEEKKIDQPIADSILAFIRSHSLEQ